MKKENDKLKNKLVELKNKNDNLVTSLNKYRQIIALNNLIQDCGNISEPLFVVSRRDGNSVFFNIYNYLPDMQATATINIHFKTWYLISLKPGINNEYGAKLFTIIADIAEIEGCELRMAEETLN